MRSMRKKFIIGMVSGVLGSTIALTATSCAEGYTVEDMDVINEACELHGGINSFQKGENNKFVCHCKNGYTVLIDRP